MARIRNRKDALFIRGKVQELYKKAMDNDADCDKFGKLEELVIDDDFCIYLISKYSRLSNYKDYDDEGYVRQFSDEDPLGICFEEVINYLDKIIIGDFEDKVKNENIGADGIVEVNGLNFQPVSRVEISDINGNSFVYLYDDNDIVAKIPFLDIISYKVIPSPDEDLF